MEQFLETLFCTNAYDEMINDLGILFVILIGLVIIIYIARHPHMKLNAIDFNISLLGTVMCIIIFMLTTDRVDTTIRGLSLFILIPIAFTLLFKIKEQLDL